MKTGFLALVLGALMGLVQPILAQTMGCNYQLNVSDQVCWTGDYTFPDGTSVTNVISQIVHTSHLQTVHTACDSLITTTITPLPYNYTSHDVYSICPGEVYTFADGTMDTIWGHTEYTSYLQTEMGCDSIVETILNTTDITNAVVVSGNNLTAAQGNAGWQWVDCADNYAEIDGADSQTFEAGVGNFAVVIYKGTCTDTSACYQVLSVNTLQQMQQQVAVYPNPSSGHVHVQLPATLAHIHVEIKNIAGQRLSSQSYLQTSSFYAEIPEEKGVYIMEIFGADGWHFSHLIQRQ